MAVTVDVVTESTRTGTGSPHTFSHVAGASPEGFLLAIMHGTSATDHVSAASYGGVALVRVQRNTDTATEPGAAEWWFLGKGVPTGTQTVSATCGATTDDIHFVAITLNAGRDIERIAVGGTDNNTANPNTALVNSFGTEAMSFGALYSGLTTHVATITAGSNCTLITSNDLAGNFTSCVVRQTTGSTGNFTVAATAATDDVAWAAVMVGEIRQITPTAGELVLTGIAAEIGGENTNITPGTGALNFGLEVGGVSNTNITPNTGSLTLTGETPNIIVSLSATPSTQGLVFTGGTPVLVIDFRIQPAGGALNITGLAPPLDITITPLTGSLVATGIQPTVEDSGAPAVDTEIRDSSKASNSGANTITVAAPTGTVSGDLVIVVVNTNNDVTLSDDNGATPFDKDYEEPSESGSGWTIAVFSRRIQGGDPSTYTFASSGSARISAVAVTFSDPDPIDIYDVAPSDATRNKNDTDTVDAPTITTSTDKSIHCAVCGADQDSAVITPPGGSYTELEQTTDQSLSFCTKRITPAGATGAQGFTGSVGGGGIIGLSFAIKNGVTSGASNTDITPDTGSLVATGIQPTLIHDTRITPTTGSLVLTGTTPTVGQDVRITPIAGALSLTGVAPTLIQDVRITPSTGSLTLTGQSGNLLSEGSITPNTGSLAFTGADPIVRHDTRITPATGTLTVTGELATILTEGRITPDTGSLSFVGNSPVLITDFRIIPATGVLSITGNSPELAGVSFTITPGTGSLVFGIPSDTVIVPNTGSLTLTGIQPTVTNSGAPSNTNITPSTGALTATGNTPIVSRGSFITPSTGYLKCSSWALITWPESPEPDVAGYKVYHGTSTGSYFEDVDVGDVLEYEWRDLPLGTHYFVVTAYDTSLNESDPGPEVSTVISGSGFAPIIGLGIIPSTGSLQLTGVQPTVQQGSISNTNITPTTGTLTATGIAPIISHGSFITPSTGYLKCQSWALISWPASPEPDIAGYKVYHGTSPGSYFEDVDVGNVLEYSWENLPLGTHYFVVTAYDTSLNESDPGPEVSTIISGSGFAPIIGLGVIPSTGALQLSGVQPNLQEGGPGNTNITPGTGVLAFTGTTPIQDSGVIPSSGVLTFAGATPIQDAGLIPSAGSLVLEGIQPNIQEGGPGNTNITPESGTLAFTGIAPVQDRTATPSTGELSITGVQPDVQEGGPGNTNITPATGALTITGEMPTQDFAVIPVTGALTVTGNSVVEDFGIVPSTGALSIIGQTPELGLSITITPETGTLTFAGIPPNVQEGGPGNTNITPASGELAFTGTTPIQHLTITPETGSMTLEGLSPIQNRSVVPATGILTMTGSSVTLASGVVLTPNAGTLIFTATDAVVRYQLFIEPLTGALIFTGGPGSASSAQFTTFVQLTEITLQQAYLADVVITTAYLDDIAIE